MWSGVTFNHWIVKLNINEVVFFTINIEGKDLEVLKLIKISKMKLKIIMIETLFLKRNKKKIKEYLKKINIKLSKPIN